MILREKYFSKFLTATTRKANYQNIVFAKITLWDSEDAYKIGNCIGAKTINNVYLGDDVSKFKLYIYRVALDLL